MSPEKTPLRDNELKTLTFGRAKESDGYGKYVGKFYQREPSLDSNNRRWAQRSGPVDTGDGHRLDRTFGLLICSKA